MCTVMKITFCDSHVSSFSFEREFTREIHLKPVILRIGTYAFDL